MPLLTGLTPSHRLYPLVLVKSCSPGRWRAGVIPLACLPMLSVFFLMRNAMCARFDPVTDPQRFRRVFGTALPERVALAGGAAASSGASTVATAATAVTPPKRTEVFPGGWAPVVRATAQGLSDGRISAGEDGPPGHEAVWAMFGLVPDWAKDTKICRSTYNARSETVAEKPSFRSAWARHRHCIVPAELITEPDYRSGKAVPTGIACGDGLPMGIAGLWSQWDGPQSTELKRPACTLGRDGACVGCCCGVGSGPECVG